MTPPGSAVPVSEVPSLPLNRLQGVSQAVGTALSSALDAQTIRDLALWPPRQVAHELVSVAVGTDFGDTAEETAEELRPALGEYPTERVYYDTLVMLGTEPPQNQTPLAQPLSLEQLGRWLGVRSPGGRGAGDLLPVVVRSGSDARPNGAFAGPRTWRGTPALPSSTGPGGRRQRRPRASRSGSDSTTRRAMPARLARSRTPWRTRCSRAARSRPAGRCPRAVPAGLRRVSAVGSRASASSSRACSVSVAGGRRPVRSPRRDPVQRARRGQLVRDR